jgi:hypothetical protein
MKAQHALVTLFSGGAAPSYTISGNVGQDGATVALGALTTTSAGGGLYSLTVPGGTSGTLAVTKTGYVFVQQSSAVISSLAASKTINWDACASATLKYVRKTGNDTTGNGSSATPWLTIAKAQNTLGSGGPYNILLGDGTYAETYYGDDHLNLANTGTALWTTQPELGADGDVTITAATGGTAQAEAFFCNNGPQTFKNLKITGLTNKNAMRVYGNKSYNFTNCTITAVGTQKAVSIDSQYTVGPFVFTNCTIAAAGGTGLYVAPTTALTNLTLTGCTVTCAGYCVLATPGTNGSAVVNLTNSTFSGANANIVSIGVDGSSGNSVTGVITNCTIANTGVSTGHACLIGAGATDCVVDGLTVSQAYDYALVLKAHGSAGHGTEVKNCILAAPTSDIYCKGAAYPNIHNNTLQGAGGVGSLQVDAQIAIKSDHVTYQYNTVKPTGTGYLFKWVTAGDNGGGVCDYNTYTPTVSGTKRYGIVLGDADVQSLTELRAAWSTYDVTTNDTNSVEA